MSRRDPDTAMRIIHLRELGQDRAECGRLLSGSMRQAHFTESIPEATCMTCLRKYRNRLALMQTVLRGKT